VQINLHTFLQAGKEKNNR